MITPAVAAVRPRIVSPTTGDALLLEDFVLQSVTSRGRGLIHLEGPKGSGKTTALKHLAATVACQFPMLLLHVNTTKRWCTRLSLRLWQVVARVRGRRKTVPQ